MKQVKKIEKIIDQILKLNTDFDVLKEFVNYEADPPFVQLGFGSTSDIKLKIYCVPDAKRLRVKFETKKNRWSFEDYYTQKGKKDLFETLFFKKEHDEFIFNLFKETKSTFKDVISGKEQFQRIDWGDYK